MATHVSPEVEVSFGSHQDLDSVIMSILTGNMECSVSILYVKYYNQLHTKAARVHSSKEISEYTMLLLSNK